MWLNLLKHGIIDLFYFLKCLRFFTLFEDSQLDAEEKKETFEIRAFDVIANDINETIIKKSKSSKCKYLLVTVEPSPISM